MPSGSAVVRTHTSRDRSRGGRLARWLSAVAVVVTGIAVPAAVMAPAEAVTVGNVTGAVSDVSNQNGTAVPCLHYAPGAGTPSAGEVDFSYGVPSGDNRLPHGARPRPAERCRFRRQRARRREPGPGIPARLDHPLQQPDRRRGRRQRHLPRRHPVAASGRLPGHPDGGLPVGAGGDAERRRPLCVRRHQRPVRRPAQASPIRAGRVR
ncbi:hypothetical protein G5V59_25860 [Nocardioides sp. W3-2-3]|uniref:hypothetical protein n=1 Tax=Nocardioides convexus TaxID=2712224 RepID=UPI002418319E|nr:hypothetical protein [Nocardioides convexus]NHA01907.1 hypothetical protein [Nocardioides convexus]